MGHGAALAPGTTFANDYRVIRPLAAGGMGTVYVAEQLSTGKHRALKLMHSELAWDAKLRERFVQEARVGASIDSEHVVEVVGAGVDQATGTPWLAMELLDGLDLAAMIERRGPLPAGEVREILGQLCHALAAAHRAGIVHRDLKPQNIFVARSRQQNVSFKVKVLDFGIAKVVAAARGTSAATAVVGTPLWMAPEQTDPNGFISPGSDVWAIGLIAFRLLTARWYWAQAAGEASSVMSLMREVLFEPIIPASARAAQLGVAHLIPPGFDAWFARCVQRDARVRFRDAAQVMQALDAGFGMPGQTGPAPTVPTPLSPFSTGGMAQIPSAPAVTPSPQGTDASGTGSMGMPVQKKRGLPPWFWLVAAVTAVLLLAGVVVIGFAFLAVGIDAANASSATVTRKNVAGTYDIVEGRNPGAAGQYFGTVEIRARGPSYQVHWALTAGPDYQGIGLLSGDVLGVAYAPTTSYALGVYRTEGGTLRGTYMEASSPGRIGHEVLSGPMGLSGTYQITESSDGLTGSLTIQRRGDVYSLDRAGYHGVGVLARGRLVVTWVPPSTPTGSGVVAYQVHSPALDGKWAPMTATMLGVEKLVAQ